MSTRDAACSCGQLHLTVEGDPIRISMCHLPRLPTADWKCLRDPSTVHIRSSARHWSSQPLRPNRGQPTVRHNLSFLPGLRRNGLLQRFECARGDCGSGRRIRRPVLPAAYRLGLRVTTASVARCPCSDGTPRLKATARDSCVGCASVRECPLALSRLSSYGRRPVLR